MGCTVRELLKRIDAKELAEWKAYVSIEPLGYDQRTDLQQAYAPCILANSNRGKGKPPYQLGEFMQVKMKPQQQSQGMIKTLIKSTLAAFRKKK